MTSGLQMHALEIPKKSALTYSVIDLRFYKSMVYYKEYKIVLRNLFRWEFVGQVLRIRWATKVFEVLRDSWRNRNEKRTCMEYTAGSLSTTKDGKWRGILRYKDADGKWRSKEKKLKSKGKRDAQKELNAWCEEMEKEAAYLNSGYRQKSVSVYPLFCQFTIDKSSFQVATARLPYRQKSVSDPGLTRLLRLAFSKKKSASGGGKRWRSGNAASAAHP